MGKSKYPNKLDTSIEIPAVRDNIIEIGSDVLNSLRSAIFNIERTLGINPQGATGNTVASRINKALDGNGNILKEALDKAGLLSGPISNADVSKSAGIDESKIKLDYPTTLLQDEISQLVKQVDNILATLEELSYLYAAHTHPESKNRHKGHAISIDAIERVSSDVGMVSSELQTAQELFENIFASHINYDGSNISSANRSHEADQIFFNKEDVSAYIDSEDVQGAIIDVLGHTRGQIEGHQNRHHSNGVLRTSVLTGLEDGLGKMLLDEQPVTFSEYPSGRTYKRFTISLTNMPPAPVEPINRSDILRLYYGTEDQFIDYQIHSVEFDGGSIKSITVFGIITRVSDTLDRIKVFRNANALTNPASLLPSVRPFPPPSTNRDVIQVANPNAATIVSRGIRPSEISVSNRYMNVSVDGGDEIIVDVYDGSAIGGNSIDTIVKAMNLKFASEGASVLAYRVDYDDLYSPEVALVHSLPSTSSESFTLSVKRNNTDDGIDSLGFSYIEDEVVDQGSGSEFYIQGEAYSEFTVKLDTTGLTMIESTASITSHAVGLDFTDYGIIKGDLLVITGTPLDDGTYVIVEVQPNMVKVDGFQLPGTSWVDEALQDSRFYFLNNTVSLAEFQFLRPHGAVGSNAAICDIFINKDRDIFYNPRLEYKIATHLASSSLVAPCDFLGDVTVYTDADPGILTASINADGITEVSLDGGIPTELLGAAPSYFWLKSGSHDLSVLIFIADPALIATKITNDGAPFSIELWGEAGINEEENLLLGRVLYDSMYSRITGGGSELPRVFNRLEAGITSDKDLSSAALKRVYQEPIGEMRSNGVVRGLELSPATGHPNHESIDSNGNYVVNISGGVCYVKGTKFTFEGYSNLISDVVALGMPGGTADKVFIAINEWGELVFAGADSSGGAVSCICPFSADSHCILSVLEYDGSNPPVAIDLRLFIDNLDLKVLNSITVSPQAGMGHFTDFGEAIKYAKRFSDMFPKAGVPTVHLKSGTHKVVVDTGVTTGLYTSADHRQAASYYGSWINFPVNITGEGHSTVLDIMKIFSDAGEEADNRTEAGNPWHAGFLMIAGPGLQTVPNGNGGVLDNGFVTISNLRLKDCSVLIFDPWVKDSDDNKLNWGVVIDKVIFDRSDKADFHGSSSGVIFESVDSDHTEDIGNLSISNCQFLNAPALESAAGVGQWPPSLHRNISFTNNTFRGTGDGALDGQTNYMVINNAGGNIFDLADAPSGNNIEFRGNINADSNSDIASVESDNEHPWGDRISRNLSVGGNLAIGKTASGLYALDVLGASSFIGPTFTEGNVDIIGAVDIVGNTDIQGPLSVTGNIEATGSIMALNEKVQIITGQDVNTGSIYIESTSSTDTAGPEIVFQRTRPTILKNYRLGELWFRGDTEGGSDYSDGAAIWVEAQETFDTEDDEAGTAIIFAVSDTGTDQAKGRLAILPSGQIRIRGGHDVTNAGYTGSLIIGDRDNSNGDWNLNDADGPNKPEQHIAIDSNEIQAKLNGTTPNTLYLNYAVGGDVSLGVIDNNILVGNRMIKNAEWINAPAGGASGLTLESEGNFIQMPSQSSSSDGIHFSTTATEESIRSFVTGMGVVSMLGNVSYGGWSHVCVMHNQAVGGDADVLKLQIRQDTSDNTNRYIRFVYDADSTVDRMSGTEAGSIYGDGSGGIETSYSFTGSHASVIKRDSDALDGMIVSSTGEIWSKKISMSTALPKVEITALKNDPKVFGVIRAIDGDFYHGYRKMNGVLEDEFAVKINSIGEGRILVSNYNGEVLNGDYIVSSDMPGYGMRQDDDILRSYTVAKCIENIDWDSITKTAELNGVKYKVYLAACTYHCG